MYSAFRCESPAVRSVSRGLVITREGVGNVWVVASGSVLKRETNFALMDFAAAPETCVCC